MMMSLREARYNPLTLLHFGAYAATPTYLWVWDRLMKRDVFGLRAHAEETYHSKVLTKTDACSIINVDRDVELKNLDHVLPFEHAKDLILKNPGNIAAFECACRAQVDNPCTPTDVCLVIGDPFADLVKLTNPLRSRRISREEALEIIEAEHARGHVHTAWFKTAMLDRFYAICNCCSCCCLGFKAMNEYNMKSVLPSGYLAEFGDECNGCGKCAKYCQFKAIEMQPANGKGKKKKAVLLEEKCYGCGVCESKCKDSNISLRLEPSKGVPLDIQALA